MEQPIRNFSGKILGWLDIKPNGDITAKVFSGRIVGYYYKNRNVTTDFSGRVLFQGDCTASLITSEKQ